MHCHPPSSPGSHHSPSRHSTAGSQHAGYPHSDAPPLSPTVSSRAAQSVIFDTTLIEDPLIDDTIVASASEIEIPGFELQLPAHHRFNRREAEAQQLAGADDSESQAADLTVRDSTSGVAPFPPLTWLNRGKSRLACVLPPPREVRRPSAAQQPHQVEAKIEILSHPGHYMNHDAYHLIDATSVEYWASLPGHTRNQVFLFSLEQGQGVISHIEWKDRGDGMGVSKLCVEALVVDDKRSPCENWQKLATWDAMQTSSWQSYQMSMSLRSSQWRVTFLANHGDESHLVVQAIRFIVKMPPTTPALNVMHSQLVTSRLWQERMFADISVLCEQTGTCFPTHRAILAAASPVLGAMLTDLNEHEIRVGPEVDERSIADTLEYIYTGQVGVSASCGMVVLGHKYDVPGLVEYAAPVALGNLTAENIAEEARILTAHVEDERLAKFFDALQNRVHENSDLLRAVLMSV